MGTVRIILTVVFLLFAFSFFLTSFNMTQKPGTYDERAANATFIYGTVLSALTYVMWAF